MRKVNLLSCLLLSTLATAMPTLAVEIDLGAASPYNAFLKNDFIVEGTDTQGRIAVGGDFIIGGGNDIGYRIDEFGMGAGPSLVVGGSVIKNGSGSFNVYEAGAHQSPHSGEIVYAGQVLNNGTEITSTVSGQVEAKLTKVTSNNLPVDFDSAFNHLTALSDSLMSATTHGVGIKDNQRMGAPLVFTPTTTPGDNVYVFNVTQEQVNANTDWFVEGVSDDATVVFNISNENNIAGNNNWKNYQCANGQVGCTQLSQVSVSINGNLLSDHLNKGDLNNRLDNQVLFNFGNATAVNISASVYGSILAPSADIKGVSGHVFGQIIGNSWESNMQINYNPFTPVGTGTPPSATVPTPATIWIFLLALSFAYINRNTMKTKRKANAPMFAESIAA